MVLMNFNSREFVNQFVANADSIKSIQTAASNQERLDLVRQHLNKNYPTFLDHLQKLSEAKCKDYKLSLKTKNAANVEFGANKCHSALLKTNKSLSLAPSGSDLLPILYGNRSAILFDLKKYKDCISNIHLALAESPPPSLKAKLLFRKLKCLMHLKDSAVDKLYEQLQDEVGTFLKDRYEQSPDVKQMKELKGKIETFWEEYVQISKEKPFLKMNGNASKIPSIDLTLKSPNDNIPVASSLIKVSSSVTFGRSVVAVEDIPPGEVIVVETPSASVLLPTEQFRLTHCHHCLSRRVNSCIPCEACSAMFCDETCRRRCLETSHRVACHVMQTVEPMEAFGVVEMLALRFVLEQTQQGRDVNALWEKISASQIDGGVQDYPNLVYRLETNEDGRDMSDKITRAFKAIVLCLLLQADSVFEDVSPTTDHNSNLHPLNDFTFPFSPSVLKFASLLVHYFQVVACNAHDVNTFFTSANAADQIQIGSGIYPFCSMFNHSCDPNVVRHTTRDLSIVVTTLKRVRAGEQLFDNYGCHYATHDKTYRQSYLKNQYRFQCCCVACEGSFPLYVPSSEGPRIPEGLPVTASLRKAAAKFEAVFTEMVESSRSVKDVRGKFELVVRYMRLLNDWVEGPRQVFEKCQETYKRLLCYVTNWEVLEDGEEMPN